MKLKSLTILTLAALVAVSSCGKHATPAKAEQKGAASTDDAEAKKAAEEAAKKKAEEEAAAKKAAEEAAKNKKPGQPLTLGDKNNKGVALLNLAQSNQKDFLTSLQAQNARFKSETKNELIAVVNVQTDASAKKLSSFKEGTYVSSFKVDSAGKIVVADVASPKMKLADKDVALDALDKTTSIFPSKEVVAVDLANPTQAVSVALDANPAVEIPSAVILKTQDKAVTEIVLDDSKEGYVAEPILFDSSYKGTAEDPTKPVCILYGSHAAGKDVVEEFPLKFILQNVLDLAEQDHKLDFSKVSKEELATIPAGTYSVNIVCIKTKLDASPNVVASTGTSGYSIKVVHAAPAAKKEEASADKK